MSLEDEIEEGLRAQPSDERTYDEPLGLRAASASGEPDPAGRMTRLAARMGVGAGSARGGTGRVGRGATLSLVGLCLALVLVSGLIVISSAARNQTATDMGSVAPMPSAVGSLAPMPSQTLGCFGWAPGFSSDILAGSGDAETGTDPPAAALRTLLADPNSGLPATGWLVAFQSSSEVMYVGFDTRFGGYVEATVVEKSGAWQSGGYGSCTLMALAPDGYGPATWTLDPSAPPTTDTTDLHILVTEMACHGTASAEGRISVQLKASGSVVSITTTVRSLSGAQTCPGTPPTPYVVHLDGPIGQRSVVDGEVWPSVALFAGGEAIVEAPPTPQTPAIPYTVAAGDTLASIAASHHYDQGEIATANPELDVYHLTAGQVIDLPGAHWPIDCGILPDDPNDVAGLFKAAAMSVSYDVYCAALPVGWAETSMSDPGQADALVQIAYAGPAGQTFTLQEGLFCQGIAEICDTIGPDLGPAKFGDKTGDLLGANGQYAVWASVKGTATWSATCTGMDVEAFKALAADLILVMN